MAESHPEATFEEFLTLQKRGWDDYDLTAISPCSIRGRPDQERPVAGGGEYDGSWRRTGTTFRCAATFRTWSEALERIREPRETEATAEHAGEDLIVSGRYSYGAFAAHVESVVDELAGGRVRNGSRASASWRSLRMERRLRLGPSARRGWPTGRNTPRPVGGRRDGAWAGRDAPPEGGMTAQRLWRPAALGRRVRRHPAGVPPNASDRGLPACHNRCAVIRPSGGASRPAHAPSRRPPTGRGVLRPGRPAAASGSGPRRRRRWQH